MTTRPASQRLGTFAGVFTPSILTILGIILFLRMGYVVGNAGLFLALAIICLANIISVLTSFSLGAIATNMRVKKGGDYYLISRTLGIEFGGAIGIVLFLAQSVSIAFYCIGFGEVVGPLLPVQVPFQTQVVAAAASLFLFGLAWIGADLATRFQYLVMACLIMALASFYLGGFARWNTDLLLQNLTPFAPRDLDFWFLFALFFPAVTGFTQGVSMSGELKDPGTSLPRGTFLAVGLSIFVYISIAVLFCGALPAETMVADYGSMRVAARWPWLITIGVVAATLSSAMASFLGAPRILQSLAADTVFPLLNPLAVGTGPSDNPRRAVLASLTIALGTIALGQLDLIAQIVSMFFLISYGLLNYATFYEARSASPSFRPQLKLYRPAMSFTGFGACLAVMLAIDFQVALLAIAILLAVYYYIKHTAGPARWADGQRSYYLQQVRKNVRAAAAEIAHPRDWRPYILAMSSDPRRRGELLTCAGWIEGNAGLTAVASLLYGTRPEIVKAKALAEKALAADIRSNESEAFPLVIGVDDTRAGFQALIQAWGVGPLHANTLLLNWHEKREDSKTKKKKPLYDGQMTTARDYGLNIALLSTSHSELGQTTEDIGATRQPRIDVWWDGGASSRLALLIAHLLTRSPIWESAAITVAAMQYDSDSETDRQDLKQALDETRIGASHAIIANATEEQMIEHSLEADLVLLPFVLEEGQPLGPFAAPLDHCFSRLPLCISVLAPAEIVLDAEPEEGQFEAIVSVIDKVNRAKNRLHRAQARVDELAKTAGRPEVAMEKEQLDADSTTEKGAGDRDEAYDPAMERALRLVIREEAKLERALREAADLGLEEDLR